MMTSATFRGFRKNANPQHYNMRHKPSQGKDGVYFHSWAHIHGPNDEAKQTNRDPTAFKYSNNLFRNDYMEWRMRGADYIYQICSRLHRSNDAWTKCLLAWTGFSFMMFSQALIWKIHFAFQMEGWGGPRESLNFPRIVNLRTDPYETSIDSSAYARFFADQLWLFVPTQQEVGKWLRTFQEFPPTSHYSTSVKFSQIEL